MKVMVCSRFIALSVRKWKNLVCGWFSDATVYIATKKKSVRPAGFEPATYGLEVRCSIQLSYGRLVWLLQIEASTQYNSLDKD